MHYKFVEPGMCQPCTKTSLEPVVEMLNSIGKRLMADGHLSSEDFKAGLISFREPEPEPEPKKHNPRSDITVFYLCRYLNMLLMPHFEALAIFSDRRARKPIVGDCSICMQRLRNKGLKKFWRCHNPVRSRNQQVKDPDYLTHCAQRCGQNFHAECMDEWMHELLKNHNAHRKHLEDDAATSDTAADADNYGICKQTQM
ncbi:hypothetical protein ACJ73_09112 [Blastomyces percursus]|uniref:RING-type domain-containing protein n=1 Tax=Blastomyces percursus TaxID=1658174 RepID=A0A1J9QDC8_9EURO|nr:hypothetical protein ACJ73_09112 [Blastomyces percursus]